jgi:mannose-1-phosphate guanylyltransferase / phosphomannomutase
MPSMTEAVIIAGGKGTRLASVAEHMPKTLVEIGGISVLEHQILALQKSGVKKVWLLLGHLSEPIQKFIEQKNWGVDVQCKIEDQLLGTAGALKQLEGEIQEDFLALSGDIMLDMDLSRLMNWHKKRGGILSLVVHPNDHPFDSELVEIDEKEMVTALLHRPHEPGKTFRNLAIASLRVCSPKIFTYIPEGEKTGIEKHIIPLLLRAGEEVYAYNTPEYIKDMGTPERLEQVRKDYDSGKIQHMSLQNERRAIFLDRDGVLNKQVDQLSKAEDFVLYDFAADAVKKINETDFMAIVVSNQPMIAKGFMTEADEEEMNKKLEAELGRKGAKVDAIYYCPHHPEKGFKGERLELKTECDCRKPEPGFLLQAKEDFNINLDESYIIGDQTADIAAGKKVGCKTVLVETGYAGKDGKYSARPDFTAGNLLKAVNMVRTESV